MFAGGAAGVVSVFVSEGAQPTKPKLRSAAKQNSFFIFSNLSNQNTELQNLGRPCKPNAMDAIPYATKDSPRLPNIPRGDSFSTKYFLASLAIFKACSIHRSAPNRPARGVRIRYHMYCGSNPILTSPA
jgi:hypothetical protein